LNAARRWTRDLRAVPLDAGGDVHAVHRHCQRGPVAVSAARRLYWLARLRLGHARFWRYGGCSRCAGGPEPMCELCRIDMLLRHGCWSDGWFEEIAPRLWRPIEVQA